MRVGRVEMGWGGCSKVWVGWVEVEVDHKLEWVGSEWGRIGCSAVIRTLVEMEVDRDTRGHCGMVSGGCMKVWVE